MQIIETMSLTQPVADFYEVLGPFYEFVAADKKKNGAINGSAIIPEETSTHLGKANAICVSVFNCPNHD